MPQLGLFASTSSATPSTFSASIPPLGFPTRIKITSSSLGFTDNLLKAEDVSDYVIYEGSNSSLFFGKTIQSSYSEILIEGEIVSTYPSWTAGATIPRTGWQNGFVVDEANPISVTITATTPQTFTYNGSAPSIAFSNNISLASDYFSFNPVIGSSSETRTTTLSLNPNADYLATNSVVVSYTINKKNVTIALTSQSSTYAPSQSYSAVAPVAITSLSGSDTISESFSSLLTGVPAQGSNAGAYTIGLNPSYASANYNITNSPASVTWTISKANQTITFNPALVGINGQTQTLSASSTSGLTVGFSVVSGPATLAGTTLTYTGTGNVVVRASQAGNTNYNPATNVDQTIVVSASGGSELPYSSTNSIDLVDPDIAYQSGNYPKVVGFSNYTDAIGTIITKQFGILNYDGVLQNNYPYLAFNVTTNRWELGIFDSYGEGDLAWSLYGANSATNPSTNQNSIPTSGWSRNIVITAGA